MEAAGKKVINQRKENNSKLDIPCTHCTIRHYRTINQPTLMCTAEILRITKKQDNFENSGKEDNETKETKWNWIQR